MPNSKGRRQVRLAHGLADLKRLHTKPAVKADAHKAGSNASQAPGSRAPAHTDVTASRPQETRGGLSGKQQHTGLSPHPDSAGQRPSSKESLLSPEDIALFKRATLLVTPLKNSRRAILPAPPKGAADMLAKRRKRALGVETLPLPLLSDQFHPVPQGDDDAHYLRRGHGTDLLKGLKRGKWVPGASLDLHGNTIEQAGERLDRFLSSCLEHQIRCVRIIHGKGYGSRDGEPVLKQSVRRWLMQLDDIIAYTECPENNGGAGAVLVLLRLRQHSG